MIDWNVHKYQCQCNNCRAEKASVSDWWHVHMYQVVSHHANKYKSCGIRAGERTRDRVPVSYHSKRGYEDCSGRCTYTEGAREAFHNNIDLDTQDTRTHTVCGDLCVFYFSDTYTQRCFIASECVLRNILLRQVFLNIFRRVRSSYRSRSRAGRRVMCLWCVYS